MADATSRIRSFWPTATSLNDYNWNSLFPFPLKETLPAGFYPPKNLRHNWLGPHSHIFALSGSVRKARSTSVTWGLPLPSPSARAHGEGQVPPAYQVFEFCGEAAIVGFFHVHDFCVCAQNVKFPGSESQEKNQPHKSLSGQRTTLDWTEQKEASRLNSPSESCYIPRVSVKNTNQC